MSHSQFHCTGRAYLDMHGLIFETSICYWQDQPGRSARSRGWDRQGPPLARSLARTGEREAGNRRGARTTAARPQPPRGSKPDDRAGGIRGVLGRERVKPRRLTRTHPRDGARQRRRRGERRSGGGGPGGSRPTDTDTHTPSRRSGPRATAGTRGRARASEGEGTGTSGSFTS